DGILRWGRPFGVHEAPEGNVRHFHERVRNGQPPPPPVHPLQALKYMGAVEKVGNVLICAPLDTPSVLGLDAQSGEVLWERKEQDPPTLIGIGEGNAIFAGAKVVAIDPQNGGDKWFAELGQDKVIGPAAVVEGKVLVPTVDATI